MTRNRSGARSRSVRGRTAPLAFDSLEGRQLLSCVTPSGPDYQQVYTGSGITHTFKVTAGGGIFQGSSTRLTLHIDQNGTTTVDHKYRIDAFVGTTKVGT